MQQLRYLLRSERLGWTWLAVPDVITMDNYRLIEDDMTLIMSEGVKRIAIDLAHVRYLYSTAMGLLIRIQKRSQEAGCIMALINVSERAREVMTSVNLDKLFTIYPTDVEFEISQGDVWEERALSEQNKFISIAQVENGICRINLSGYMTGVNDLSAFDETLCQPDIAQYVFDLTGLELIDSFGLSLMRRVLVRIRDTKGSAVAYGTSESIVPLLNFMALDEYINLYENEREALEAIGKA